MIPRVLTVFAVGFVVTACIGTDPTSPGEKVGTFHVTAKLTKTSCGQPPSPWEFDVKLNHDGSVLYWIQGQQPIAGEVDRTARATMTSRFTDVVREANAQKKLAACSIERSDSLNVILATADAKPAVDPGDVHSFSGSLSYTFTATDGSQCSDQLTASGGGYDALPCEVTYEVAGALTKKAASN